MDLEAIKAAIMIYVGLGGIMAPGVFAIVDTLKPFISTKYLPIIAPLIGGLLGIVIGLLLPELIASLAVAGVSGLIGGYLSTKMYDRAVDETYKKIDKGEDI